MNNKEWTDKIARYVEEQIESDTWCHYVSWGELNEMVKEMMAQHQCLLDIKNKVSELMQDHSNTSIAFAFRGSSLEVGWGELKEALKNYNSNI